MINIEHNFFETAGKAFINYLDSMFKPFENTLSQKFPIFINNTGDEVYLGNMHKEGTAEAVKYSSTPRLPLEVRGITMLGGQFTNGHDILGNLNVKNEKGFSSVRKVPVKRIPVEWVIGSEAVFENIFQYLQFVEILLTVSQHNHVFSFYYAGREYQGAFFLQEDLESRAKLDLSYDSERRRRNLPMTFVVELQYPAFDIYDLGLYKGHDGFSPNETMQKLIHNQHVNDESPSGIVSTIEITKNT